MDELALAINASMLTGTTYKHTAKEPNRKTTGTATESLSEDGRWGGIITQLEWKEGVKVMAQG